MVRGDGPSRLRSPYRRSGGGHGSKLAALDLGTNNCRLLIASPTRNGLRIVDAFSRIVRLGEGVSTSGNLSQDAMERTMSALMVCAKKIHMRGVTHSRCIATQACRSAANGEAFLAEVKEKTGLSFEVIEPEEEARLSVAGCNGLIDSAAKAALIFDIGGGSTELSWISRNSDGELKLENWASMAIGVVNLSEKWGGRKTSKETYASIVEEARKEILKVGEPQNIKAIFEAGEAHLLGTSGTVTSIAGVHLGLSRYQRDLVDGLWLSIADVRQTTETLRAKPYEERKKTPCIGEDRADLVIAGCAILEALISLWPVSRVRVADRGLREGMLSDLARIARDERNSRN